MERERFALPFVAGGLTKLERCAESRSSSKGGSSSSSSSSWRPSGASLSFLPFLFFFRLFFETTPDEAGAVGGGAERTADIYATSGPRAEHKRARVSEISTGTSSPCLPSNGERAQALGVGSGARETESVEIQNPLEACSGQESETQFSRISLFIPSQRHSHVVFLSHLSPRNSNRISQNSCTRSGNAINPDFSLSRSRIAHKYIVHDSSTFNTYSRERASPNSTR